MLKKKKVLIVEDNEFVRMQIKSFLVEAEYDVVEATDGEAALDVMSGDPDISICIVDVRMEPMDGLEFIRILRGEGIETPTVLVTGDQTSDLLEQSGRLSIGAVLMKPVEKSRLLQTVERIVAISERRVP